MLASEHLSELEGGERTGGFVVGEDYERVSGHACVPGVARLRLTPLG